MTPRKSRSASSAKKNVRPNGKIHTTIYWAPHVYDHARTLATRESRSINRFLNLTVERIWAEQFRNDAKLPPLPPTPL